MKRTLEQRKAQSEKLKKSGKWNIKPGWNKGIPRTEEQKRKHSEAMKGKSSPMKGKFHTTKANEKNRQAHLGKPGTFKGKYHTEESKEKNRIAHLGKKASMETRKKMSQASKGRTHSEETKKKMSIAMKGKEPWCKGRKLSIEHVNQMRQVRLGKKIHTPESKKKISEAGMGRIPPNKGMPMSEELKMKARIGTLRHVEGKLKNGLRLVPFYNFKACEYFKQFDEINNTEGQYATNGGELCILGYWLDYINHDKKLIIEWDEEAHYFNGKLKEKDIIRQKEIENHFPGYTFIRIRESKYIPEALHLLREMEA